MKIHFIGIGGIGVSALAQYYLKKGNKVSGSDLVSSEITENLKKMGAKVHIGKHKAENVPKDVNMVIYSPAVQETNPELKKAKEFKIQIKSYPQALGELTKKYYTIAVCGTHGKSTTTAMIGLVLIKAGLDPTVLLGTKLKEFKNTNCRMGESKYLVIEADEWQASFLNYWPKIIVLTNIEKEHLDFYKNLTHILKTYREFVGHLSQDGVLVGNGDDENVSRIKNKESRIKNKEFSLKQKETKILEKILKVPGEYNIYNALAALTVARVLKIPDEITFKALSEYQGAWRRFEIKKFQIPNSRFQIPIISDYAHHPTEIKAALKAAREKFKNKKIWCIFQPHQYQRTFYLFNDFVKVFSLAPIDKLIITDIYDVAGREKGKIKKKIRTCSLRSQNLDLLRYSYTYLEISSKKLASSINPPALYISTIKEIKNYLRKNLSGGEVVIIMGAGDIYKLTDGFLL